MDNDGLTVSEQRIKELEEKLKQAAAYLYVFQVSGCKTCHREIVAKDMIKMLEIEIE